MRCKSCAFTRIDPTMCTDIWNAVECSNPVSEYYKSLLNINTKGDTLQEVVWEGCQLGVQSVVKKLYNKANAKKASQMDKATFVTNLRELKIRLLSMAQSILKDDELNEINKQIAQIDNYLREAS